MPQGVPARVLILIDSLLAGGAERVAVETAARLDRGRFSPHLLVTRHTGPLAEIAADAGIPVTYLERRHRLDPRGLWSALGLVRASDLVHAHKFAGSMLGAGLARLARRPLVAHEHTFGGVRTRGRTLGYRYWIAPAARRIICVSEFVAQSLRDEGVPNALISVVPNGVPVDATLDRAGARAELGLRSSAIVLGMVGRLRPEKRHDLAIAALAQLRARGLDITLCVVGDGPLRPDLEALAETLGVSDAVLFAGERPNAGRLARAFDLMVMCSTFEGMPLAALEALVVGVPIVATAVGGLPELVRPGTGILVSPGDPEALAEGIATLLDGSELTLPPEDLRRQYDIATAVRVYERIYDETLGVVDPWAERSGDL